MDIKPDSIIRVPCSSLRAFYKYWLKFLQPFHNLTQKELEVLACLIEQRFKLSRAYKDDALIDRILMSKNIKKLIKEECKVSQSHLYIIIQKLVKNNIIINNKINPKFIPNISEDSNKDNFKLLLYFEIK